MFVNLFLEMLAVAAFTHVGIISLFCLSRFNCPFVCPSLLWSLCCRPSGAGERAGRVLPVVTPVLAAPAVGSAAVGAHAGRARPRQPERATDPRRHGRRPAQVLLYQARGSPEQGRRGSLTATAALLSLAEHRKRKIVSFYNYADWNYFPQEVSFWR